MPGLLKAIGYNGARPRKNQPSSFWLREGHRLEEILYDVHILYRNRAKQVHSDVTGGQDNDIKYLNGVYQRIKKIISQKLSPQFVLPRNFFRRPPIKELKLCHCGCGKKVLTTKKKPFFDESCRRTNLRKIWRRARAKRAQKKLDATAIVC